MSLTLSSSGENAILEMIVGKSISQDLTLRLFVNDKTPKRSDTAASYMEPKGAGYSGKLLNGSKWKIKDSTATIAAQSFVFSDHVGEVFGYFVTQSSGRLLWAERFTDGPYMILNQGDTINVVPSFSLKGE